jgi:hypothetical protein
MSAVGLATSISPTFDLERGDDVALLAVHVVQQRNAGRPVGSYSIAATLAGY